MSGQARPGSASRNRRRQINAESSGTCTPFRPFLQVGIDESERTDSKNAIIEVETLRYQTITMLPEYRDKSLEELRLEDYKAKRHRIPQQVPAASTQPTFVPGFPRQAGLTVNNQFFASLRSQYENIDNIGTYIPFQPFIGIDIIIKTNKELEARYQTVSVIPEYGGKSVEELRLEDYTANRQSGRQLPPASTELPPSIFRFGENNDDFAAPKSEMFNFGSNQFQPFVADESLNCGTGRSAATVLPGSREEFIESLRRHDVAASAQQATPCERFEDYALKIPLQPLPLQDTDPDKIALDGGKFIATRTLEGYCNVFVTFSSQLQTNQFIVIQILKTNPTFTSGLRLYIKDLKEGPYLQRKLLYSDVHCKPNDFLIIWLTDDDGIKVIRRHKNLLTKPTCFPLPEAKTGQFQLLGDMCGSVEQLRAFVGDQKKAEPFLWTRPAVNHFSSALVLYTDDSSSSLSLIGELQDDKLIPIDIDLSTNLRTINVNSGEISEPGSSDEDNLCKVCIDNEANVVLIPCGHLCVCYECVTKMRFKGHKNCPICRSFVQNTQKVYFS